MSKPAEPKQKLSTQTLKQTALQLGVVPLIRPAQSIGFVRGEDGGGFYPVQGTDTVNSVAYVFNTGEIWVIDAWLSQIPQYLELDERIFSATLQQQIRWDRTTPVLERWIPPPRILHPYPEARFYATHPS